MDPLCARLTRRQPTSQWLGSSKPIRRPRFTAARPPPLDHAVVNGRDQMDRAVQIYRRLGFHMTERGYHTLGSINHLATLEHDYIELIGFKPNTSKLRTDILRF